MGEMRAACAYTAPHVDALPPRRTGRRRRCHAGRGPAGPGHAHGYQPHASRPASRCRGSTPPMARTSRRRSSGAARPRRRSRSRSSATIPTCRFPQPFVHWVIYNIPATANGLPENLPDRSRSADAAEIAGAVQGLSGFRRPIYRGPAPPPGKPHHYHFIVYALDVAGPAARSDEAAARRRDAGPHRRPGRAGRHLRAQAPDFPARTREDADGATRPLTSGDLLKLAGDRRRGRRQPRQLGRCRRRNARRRDGPPASRSRTSPPPKPTCSRRSSRG